MARSILALPELANSGVNLPQRKLQAYERMRLRRTNVQPLPQTYTLQGGGATVGRTIKPPNRFVRGEGRLWACFWASLKAEAFQARSQRLASHALTLLQV